MTWLSVLSSILSLLSSLFQYVNAQRERSAGWAEAVNYGLQLSSSQISAAADELNKAEERHAKNPTSDAAFDPQFKRAD